MLYKQNEFQTKASFQTQTSSKEHKEEKLILKVVCTNFDKIHCKYEGTEHKAYNNCVTIYFKKNCRLLKFCQVLKKHLEKIF